MLKLFKIMFFILCFLVTHWTFAQQDLTWDNTVKSSWNPLFQRVAIPSTKDDSRQQAYFFKSTKRRPQPLIVSLHTWSGDYQQKDPLAKEILARDWNYIHPDVRGRNNRPEAMGSLLVMADIKDAIEYAVNNGNVDTSEIHIIGVSGGGYATLCAYMQLDYPVKSFSAWAPIADIEAWYWESIGRGQKYAADIVAALGGTFDPVEARKRSPLFQQFHENDRRPSSLYLFEGIHDGYTGSVPITHSLNMFNRLVAGLKYQTTSLDSINQLARLDSTLISDREIIDLLTKRTIPLYRQHKKELSGRRVYLEKQFDNIHLTIFEGTHEQLPQALSYLPVDCREQSSYRILTIGDSNGQIEGGWVDQMRKILPNAQIINNSQSGRTIGFDNGGREKLNALKNIDNYLEEAAERANKKPYDFIIVCLGTNDTKNEFSSRQVEILENLSALLTKICQHGIVSKRTRLLYVTPPPIRAENIDTKYQGSNERLAQLVPRLVATAKVFGFKVVDIYHPLLGVLDYYAKDGVHMTPEGQQIVAAQIVATLEE